MNEELVQLLVEATDWHLSPMLYGPLRELLVTRLMEVLPGRAAAFILHPLATRLHQDEFLADNVMVLCKGTELVGMARFEQGQVTFARFKETPPSWGLQPTEEMRPGWPSRRRSSPCRLS